MQEAGVFDDALLEDSEALAGADEHLRWLAGAGARIRVVGHEMAEAGSPERLALEFDAGRRPRGVIVLGAEARLVRAVLEPVCPVPLVAWPFENLPGWVGPLDLVVVLAPEGSREGLMSVVAEARRRGVPMLVAARPDSPIAEQAASRSTVVLPVSTADPLAAAIGVLGALNALGLGPAVVPETTATAVDQVAEACSPHVDLSANPAKELALGLADGMPLVWGGTVLAARASRRIAEALRRTSGRPALAADASELEPLIEAAGTLDPFADPFDDGGASLRPVLVVLDGGSSDQAPRRERGSLVARAQQQRVRVCEVQPELGSPRPVDAYAALLMHGLFGAAYLGVGLGATLPRD